MSQPRALFSAPRFADAASLVKLGQLPDESRGLFVLPHANVLLVLGAGTQGFFKKQLCRIRDRAKQMHHFGNDALVADLAGALERNASVNGMPVRFAVVTLNITWDFPHQFSFHGTLAGNDIPQRNNTHRHTEAACDFVGSRFQEDMNIHLVFVGVGMTQRNGNGFPAFIKGLQTHMRINDVTVVDPFATNWNRRIKWLRSETKCAIPSSTRISHVQKGASDWLEQLKLLPGLNVYRGPARTEFFNVIQSKACHLCVASAGDPYVLQLVFNWIARQNGLRRYESQTQHVRSRSQHASAAAQEDAAPPILISRIHPDASDAVLKMAMPAENQYWVGRQLTRIVVNASGTIIGYIIGTIVRYLEASHLWCVAYENGHTELLELYEVVLGVQLYCVRSHEQHPVA